MPPIDDRWHPVAHSRDLAPRHVFHGKLHGIELALWRDDAGQVNAWENRCPHRSVRFTLGVNLGDQLRCQYHGWQYRSEDGRCTRIPAASQSTPPTSLCARGFAATETGGYIWVNLSFRAGEAQLEQPRPIPLPLVLRSLPFRVDTQVLLTALADYTPATWGAATASKPDDLALQLDWPEGRRLHFWLQPLDRENTLVHSSCTDDGRTEALQLREHNLTLSALRRHLERSPRALPEPVTPSAAPAASAVVSRLVPRRPAPDLAARVVARQLTGGEVLALTLRTEAQPPHFEAGAHIEVLTPNGFKRQYSLLNGPDERDHLLIGVKLEPTSRGGSRSLHEQVTVGDTLKISAPKNLFRLHPDAPALLIAGGIGITPLLAMGATLQARKSTYELHYFVRSEALVAFPERLHQLRHSCLHTGLTPEQTVDRLQLLLSNVDAATHLYVCGPGALIDAVLALAARLGITEERVHHERFTNPQVPVAGRAFRVRLQRSGKEFEVPGEVSLADALKAQGIALDTSCEQGVCGTCRTAVLDGLPEHRDLFLNEEERQRNDCLMPCVSRSHSNLLVLDL